MLDTLLKGKRGLVVGIANEHSIAAGCGMALRASGADLAVTYGHEASKLFVSPVAAKLDTPIFLPLDVQIDAQLEAVFEEIDKQWGKLDFVLHSIACCTKDDLHGPVSECSKEGFAQAMDVPVHSLIRMTRLAVPLMKDGGSILTMSYYAAEKAGFIGFTKALAQETAAKGITVNAVAPGYCDTDMVAAVPDEVIDNIIAATPVGRLGQPADGARAVICLAGDDADFITGSTLSVNGGEYMA